MLVAKKALKPRAPRVHVLPIEIKGLLSPAEAQTERVVPFLLWDISAAGLGILLSDRFEPGELLRLTFAAPVTLTVDCHVVWCELQEADYDFQEPSFRVGLVTVGKHNPLQPLVDYLDHLPKK